MIGVYANSTQTISGILEGWSRDSSSFFALTRSAQADTIKDPVLESIGGSRFAWGFGGPSENRINEWADRFVQEYPGSRPNHIEMGKLFTDARKLFRDKYFIEYFGKTYDQLNRVQRTSISNKIRAGSPSEGGLARNFWAERAFGPSGTYGRLDITISVVALRTLEAWYAEREAWLETHPHQLESFQAISELDNVVSKLGQAFWPSEIVAMVDHGQKTRSQIAGPLLQATTEQLLAMPPSFEGAKALSHWRNANAELIKWAPSDFTQMLQSKVFQTQDAVLSNTWQNDLYDESKWGDGVDALKAGGNWYREFSKKYAFATERPPYQRVMDQFRILRDGQVAQSQQALTDRMEQATRVKDIDATFQLFLAVPGDFASPAGQAIQMAGNRRKRNIEHILTAQRKSQSECGTVPSHYQEEPHGSVLYALETPCLRTFSEKEQLFIAGLSQKILQECGLPASMEGRSRLQAFLSSSMMVATIGGQYGNPNLGETPGDQASSTMAYAAGGKAFDLVGCDGRAVAFTDGVGSYLERTASGNGSGARYVKGCVQYYSERYSERQCQCLADLGRGVIPNIHQMEFDRESISNLIKRNPIVALQVWAQCRIGDY